MIFHSFQTIFYYRDGEISQIESEIEFHFSFFVDDHFFVREQKRGLCLLDGKSVDLVKGGELFRDMEIVNLLLFSKGSFLILTALNGLYLYDGDKISPWNEQGKLIHLFHLKV